MPFKIAIDSGPLTSGHSVRGIGVMVKEQIKEIEKLAGKNFVVDPIDFSMGSESLASGNYDIVHYTSFFPYTKTLPDEKYGKYEVVTIQDLIHLIYPDKYPPGIKGRLNLLRQKRRLKKTDAVITISETSKKDIVRFLDISPEKVKVVYLAQKEIFKKETDQKLLGKIRKKYQLPEKFVLYVGDINYNKNTLNLIDACELAKIPLVIVGKQAKAIEDTDLMELMSMSGPQDWLRFLLNKPHPEIAHYSTLQDKFKKNNVYRLGYVPDEEINAVFNLSSVYFQPSFYEGFGLPVLEAMASQVPVIVSKTNCLVEIAGEAALTADPNDPDEMAQKITKVINDKKVSQDLVSKGIARSKMFSWEKTGKGLVDVYQKLAGNKI